MEYQVWVEECRQLLDSFKQSVQTIQDGIRSDPGFAFYHDDEESIYDQDARDAIAQHLGEYFYTSEEGGRSTPVRYMAACCSIATLEMVQGLGGLNHTKLLFRRFHEELRSQFKTEVEATQAMRDVLGHCQAKTLNIEAVDRRVPCLPGPALRIGWYFNQTAPSARKTLRDAINHLNKLYEQANGDRRSILQQEIAQLQSLPASLPVAHRLRKPIKALKFRAQFLDLDSQRGFRCDYGKNPVLFSGKGVLPTLDLPKNPFPGDRRGRPSTISDQVISPSLPNWFFYRDPEISAPAKKVQRAQSKRNPHSSTAVPGIWFYRNTSGNPGFRYRRPSGSISSVAIKRGTQGMQQAWSTAIKKSWPNKDDDEILGLCSLCPGEDALNRFLNAI